MGTTRHGGMMACEKKKVSIFMGNRRTVTAGIVLMVNFGRNVATNHLEFDQALQPKGLGKTCSWRVYVAMRLNLPRRGKQRLPDRIREPLAIPDQANHTWSADFMADTLWSGRRFRTFNVNDDFNRESLRVEIDTSLPSLRVIRPLDELVELRSAPQRLRLDNVLTAKSSTTLRRTHPKGAISAFIDSISDCQEAIRGLPRDKKSLDLTIVNTRSASFCGLDRA